MKKHKRDGLERAFNHGYRAALNGKSISSCPHENETMKFQWTSGWREGRHDLWDGSIAIAGLHKHSA